MALTDIPDLSQFISSYNRVILDARIFRPQGRLTGVGMPAIV
jgi:hypothetical protein